MSELLKSEVFIQEDSNLAKEIFKKLSELVVDIKEEGNDNTFKVIMSKQISDRDGETIIIDGIDTKSFMKNPLLLNSHNYRGIDNIIGKFTKIYKEDINGSKALIGEGVFAVDLNPMANMANELYKAGFLKAVSVGFIPKLRDENDRSIITKSELLECSFVTVPANPEALDIMKSKGMDTDKMKDLGLILKEDSDFNIHDIYNDIKDIKETLNLIKENFNISVSEKKEEQEIDQKDKVLMAKKEIQAIVNEVNDGLANLKKIRL